MTADATPERRQDLGMLVRRERQAARLSVDLAAERAGMSPVTWSRVEKGDAVRGLTYAGIELTLRWTRGSIEGFLAGGTEPSPQTGQTTAETEEDHDEIEMIRNDPNITDGERAELIEYVRERRRQLRKDVEMLLRHRPAG